MNQIQFNDLINRVLTSSERVQFSHVDPYGHLNASRYVEFFLNHRIHAAEEQLQCFTMDILKETSIGFVVRDIQVSYISPCFQGEILEIGSWVKSKSENGFELNLVMSSQSKKKVKAVCRVKFVSVDMKTGKPTVLPQSLPTRSNDLLIEQRMMVGDYIQNLIGLPEEFYE